MSARDDRTRACPACRHLGAVSLSEIALARGVGHFCLSCDGIWLDAPVQVLMLGRGLVRDPDASPASRGLECPACSTKPAPALIRSRAGTDRANPVEVDLCPGCAGAWLDRGELQALRRAAESTASEPGAVPGCALPAAPTKANKDASGIDVVELGCPHCGAPSPITDEDCAVTCEHCGSWLTPIRPDDYEILRLPANASSEEQLRTSLIHARIARMQLESFGQFGQSTDSKEDVEAEWAIERERRRLVEHLRVGRRRLLHFPYWHSHGVDYLAALGRPLDGLRREARLISRRWEHTQTGYDATAFRLRDQGGRLGIAGCRLLTREDIARGLEAVAPVDRPLPAADWDHRPSYALTSFEAFDETQRRERGVWARNHLIFKPYWIVRYSIAAHGRAGAQIWWSLVDASQGRVVAELDPGEESALLRAPSVDPLGARAETEVRIVASRCPECGRDQLPDRRAWLRVCPNCHEGLEMTSRGFARAPYSVVPSKGGSAPSGHLPFWRLEVATADSARSDRAPQPEATLFPGGEPGSSDSNGWLWVPALRLLGTKLGDAAFVRLVRWANAAGLEVEEEQFPATASVGRLVPASVPASHARELVAAALSVVHERRPPAEARRVIDSARVAAEPALVLVPALVRRNRWRLPGLPGGVPEIVVSGSGVPPVGVEPGLSGQGTMRSTS